MLVTRGFRDSLEIRRGIRQNAWDHRRPFPPVARAALPAPARRRPHRSPWRRDRATRAGGQSTSAVDVFRQEGVSSVAICLYNSFLSDAHEATRRCARPGEVYPECWVTLSSHVAPIMGEYERSSTAVHQRLYRAARRRLYGAHSPPPCASAACACLSLWSRTMAARCRSSACASGRRRCCCRAPRPAWARWRFAARRWQRRICSPWRSAAPAAT